MPLVWYKVQPDKQMWTEKAFENLQLIYKMLKLKQSLLNLKKNRFLWNSYNFFFKQFFKMLTFSTKKKKRKNGVLKISFMFY